jgi:sigma-B regulation protein RsbU (phosphoserine phosphatase)
MRLLPVEPNLPLGIIKGTVFKEQERILNYDDALLLYTDGLTEAENTTHDQFGEKRMLTALHGRKSALAHLETIKQNISEFVGDAPQSDDLTMLFLHYLGGQPPTRLVLGNDIRQLSLLPRWMESVTRDTGLDELSLTNLNLAIEEAVTNVMCYAYPEGESGELELEAVRKDHRLEFILSDSGKPFDPTAVPDADTTASVEDRPIGGLGIYLVRTIMDSVRYERKDGKNYLYMTKNI